MSTPLQSRIRTAAASDPTLATLLGTSPFRWFNNQLPQGYGQTAPAIVVTQISGSPTYVLTGRLRTGWTRLQFLIWGGQFDAGATARETVEAALITFLDSWSGGIGITGLTQYPSLVVGQRDFLFAQTDGPIYQRVTDAMIFSNSSLN